MHPLTSVAFWPLVTWTFSSFPGAIVMPDWYFLSRNHNDHINPLGHDLPKLCRFHHFLTTLFLTMKWSPQILLLRCLHVRTKWMLMVMHPLTSVAFLTSCNMNFFPRFPGPSWCLVDTFFPEIIMIILILWVFIFVCHPFVATIDCYRFPLNDK